MTNQKEIKIKAKDEELKGVYSNLMQVLHTKEEFALAPPSMHFEIRIRY